jgi:hypothetical protein
MAPGRKLNTHVSWLGNIGTYLDRRDGESSCEEYNSSTNNGSDAMRESSGIVHIFRGCPEMNNVKTGGEEVYGGEQEESVWCRGWSRKQKHKLKDLVDIK